MSNQTQQHVSHPANQPVKQKGTNDPMKDHSKQTTIQGNETTQNVSGHQPQVPQRQTQNSSPTQSMLLTGRNLQHQTKTESEQLIQPQMDAVGTEAREQRSPRHRQMSAPSDENRDTPPVQDMDPGKGSQPPRMQDRPVEITTPDTGKVSVGQEPSVDSSEGGEIK
jgi:hypothetical protein